MIRRCVLLLLAGICAKAANQTDLPRQLTLSQALQIALTNSTTIREAMASLEQATGQYQQARSYLLPQLNLGARQSYQTINLLGYGIDLPGISQPGAQQLIGPFGSMDARVFFTQELFNLADIRSSQSFRTRQDSSRLLVNDARELVALRVVSTYLEALRAKATRDTLTEQEVLANELYKITRDRVTQGVSAELDANRAMQKVNAIEQMRQEAEQSYVAAKLSLANILQARITAEFDVADEAAYGTGAAPERTAAITFALSSRPDYRAAEDTVKAAELQVRSIKATRLPTLGMSAGDGQSGSTPAHNVNTYRVAGTIELPIFTGGYIHGQIEEAEGALRDARAALDENRSQIETDVQTAISGIQWALREVETSVVNVRLSRQEVDFTRSRFTQGIADNTEVVNAQDRLTQADDAYIRAHFNLGLARANLARAIGAAEKTYRR
jgi:outer membrane protein